MGVAVKRPHEPGEDVAGDYPSFVGLQRDHEEVAQDDRAGEEAADPGEGF